MTILTNAPRLPGAQPFPALVEIELIGEGGAPVVGYVTGTNQAVQAQRQFHADGDNALSSSVGEWSVNLTPNASIEPAGTVYRIVEHRGRTGHTTHIVSVPAAGGPYSVLQCLTDVPGSLPFGPLLVHLLDPTDAHDASAVSFSPAVGVAATDLQGAVVEVAGDVTAETAARIAGDALALAKAANLSDVANAATARTNLAAAADAAVVHLAGTESVTGVKTFAANNVSTILTKATNDPGGTSGIHLSRTPGAGALTLAFLTGSTKGWEIGLDLDPAAGSDLVLAYDAIGNGSPGLSTSDVLRLRHGPCLSLANTAMPNVGARFAIASNGTYATNEPQTLNTLLLMEIGDAASGITHLIKASTPGAAFGVTKAGWLAAGTITPGAPLHSQSTGAVDGMRIQCNASADPGTIVWGQGSGSTDWRMGRTVDGNANLAISQANGSTSTTAAAPGTQLVLLTRNGAMTITSLAAASFPLTLNALAGAAYPNYIQQWRTGGALVSGIIPTGSFLAVGLPGVQFSKDTSFTRAAHIGMAFPVGTQQDDLILSSYTTPDATWTETGRVVNKVGHLKMLGALITKRTTAPADADLAAGEMAIWFDPTNGAAKLMVKAKETGGTVRTGSLALA